MQKFLWVTIGSGLGGLSRYGLTQLINSRLGTGFPSGTLLVNISGCFLIGLLFTLILQHWQSMSDYLQPVLLMGFLGGFTTFSTFTLETFNLAEMGQLRLAALNVVLSVVVGLAATWGGVLLARQL